MSGQFYIKEAKLIHKILSEANKMHRGRNKRHGGGWASVWKEMEDTKAKHTKLIESKILIIINMNIKSRFGVII